VSFYLFIKSQKMKVKKYFFVLLLAPLLVLCHKPPNHQTSKLKPNSKKNVQLASLKANKRHIDSLLMDTDRIIVLVKVPGSNDLQIIKNGKFPDEVETTYNLFSDRTGHIVYILESPTSESGDWDIVYESYFNGEGNLFCFERTAGFFNVECSDGSAKPEEPVHEKLIKYFNTRSKPIDSVYTLVDHDNKPLNKSKCVSPYNYPYNIIFSVNNYLNMKKITKNLKN